MILIHVPEGYDESYTLVVFWKLVGQFGGFGSQKKDLLVSSGSLQAASLLLRPRAIQKYKKLCVWIGSLNDEVSPNK
ncbi:hypothetical protein Mapa_005823 [Marchantia paleacea]|nr:hypothetical protein Mapa_005823 [Marchantia paleacea]